MSDRQTQPEAVPPATPIHIEVAVPTPLPRTFTYLASNDVAAGSRVVVPFAGRKLVGVALGRPAAPPEASLKLKHIDKVVDESPVYSQVILDIAKWIAGYYMHPLGEVLRTMLPAGSAKVVHVTYQLSKRGIEARDAAVTGDLGQIVKDVFGKRGKLSAPTLRSKLKKLGHDVKELIDAGLVTQVKGTTVKARRVLDGEVLLLSLAGSADTAQDDGTGDKPPQLTALQQHVVNEIITKGPSKPFLLHGVTGSGKTEVYLHLIASLPESAQVLVLVPEISLTPQMTYVFERRFPGEVVVVHSAMSDPDRWAQLDKIRRGEARILIGPRSAVFGPFQNLKMLLVDEEHDGSYKQSTGLNYNGRDVAVLRAKLEGATVVLGSATPSLETYQNALSGRYHLLSMPERVSGRPMPEIEIISAEKKFRGGATVGKKPGGAHAGDLINADTSQDVPIDPRIVSALQANFAAGRQAIVLVNRRGYAYYLLSLTDQKPVQCPHCSISLTIHQRSTVLRCHYCDYQTTVDKVLKERPDETFLSIGYGSQKAEDYLARILPTARIERLDSDTTSERDHLPRTLAKFRAGELDVMVGTQMLAKGHDFPNVTLIVILEVDQLLGLPDFRAGERTFQLIVQAAGRAGRAELPGKVMIQSLRASHPVVQAAVHQDFLAFATRELSFRQGHAYPPFARLVAFELNGPDAAELLRVTARMEAWFAQMNTLKPDLVRAVRVLGPAVPPIETIRGRHRRFVILSSADVEPLRRLAAFFLQAFQKLPGDLRLKVDVDPQSLI